MGGPGPTQAHLELNLWATETRICQLPNKTVPGRCVLGKHWPPIWITARALHLCETPKFQGSLVFDVVEWKAGFALNYSSPLSWLH